MSIKALVNNHDLYQSLLEEIDTWIEKEQKSLEQTADTVQLYRTQGSIKTLRKLKTLKEIVYGRD